MTAHPALDVAKWDDTVPPGIIVIDGNAAITVHSGHLVIKDGTRTHPRTRRLTRSQRAVRHIVNLAQHGYITWEAHAWMRGAGVAFTDLASVPRYRNWKAVRSQAYGSVRCARYLIGRKITGSARNLEALGRGADARAVDSIMIPNDLQGVKNAEMQAARRYWKAWQETVILPWRGSDARKIPAQWRETQLRKASSRSNNYDASDPLNAMLNYAYRVGETACYAACVSAGLDPVMGVIHEPQDNRDSFALDLLEAVRPQCDARIIRLVHTMQYFDPRWVHETGKGVCRLDAPLTHTIAGWASVLFDAALPVAVEAARILRRDHA